MLKIALLIFSVIVVGLFLWAFAFVILNFKGL